MNPQGMMAAFEDSDFEKMSEIRARVNAIVQDPDTAENLKAWYNQLCKRPCFHDEYLDSYNQPGTYLIDTDGKGVERITEKGVVVAGVEYEVDCIIYASGFEVGTPFDQRNGFDPVGRDGLALSEYWADGMRSKHGMHVHNFPNLFIVAFTQGANLISNVPHNLTEGGKTAALTVKHALDNGYERIEVTAEAEQSWLDLLATGPGRMMMGNDQCTPGYYNNEGQPLPEGQSFVGLGYPQGAQAFFKYIDAWRTKGDFEGLTFS
jgi:cation diffusion facilitator CzcD-associated flavoprotein CzcO